MILRDAVLSDETVSLEWHEQVGLEPLYDSTAHPLALQTPGGAPQIAPCPVIAEPVQPVPEVPAAAAVVPQPPSLEIVLDWLQNCEPTQRAALTEALAGDMEQLRETARAQGHASGFSEGLAQAGAQVETTLSILENLSSAAQSAFDREIGQLAEQCAEVVVAALCKIAGSLLAAPEAALSTVLEVLKRVKEEREIVIRVAVPDMPVLRAAEDRIARSLAGRPFSLVEDDRVNVGGCIVESKLGSLDGRLDLQLRALGETIRAAKIASTEPS